jgi:obg-like ATPase 1
MQLLTAKPVTYLVNLSERDYIRKKNKWLPKIKAWVDENNTGDLIIPFSVALEERIARMSAEEQKKELETLGATSALGKIMTVGYQSLHVSLAFLAPIEKVAKLPWGDLQLIRYFTAGPDESRAWTIRDGTLAPQAAGVIHGDFEKHFICGEVMAFDDLHALGSEAAVKADGKYMQKGKTYEVQDGDIIYWKHNA